MLGIYALVVFVTMWVGAFGGLGHLIAYYLIKMITYSLSAKKVEFSLSEEDFYVDRRVGILGICKIQDGKTVFLGCRPRGKALEEIDESIEMSETQLRVGSKMGHRVLVFLTALIGLIVSVLSSTMILGD